MISKKRALMAALAALVLAPAAAYPQTTAGECATAGGSYTETCETVAVKFLGITIGSKTECKSSCSTAPKDAQPAT